MGTRSCIPRHGMVHWQASTALAVGSDRGTRWYSFPMIPLTQGSRWVVGADGGTCLGCAFHLETNGWSAEQTFSRHRQAAHTSHAQAGWRWPAPAPAHARARLTRIAFGSDRPRRTQPDSPAPRTARTRAGAASMGGAGIHAPRAAPRQSAAADRGCGRPPAPNRPHAAPPRIDQRRARAQRQMCGQAV